MKNLYLEIHNAANILSFEWLWKRNSYFALIRKILSFILVCFTKKPVLIWWDFWGKGRCLGQLFWSIRPLETLRVLFSRTAVSLFYWFLATGNGNGIQGTECFRQWFLRHRQYNAPGRLTPNPVVIRVWSLTGCQWVLKERNSYTDTSTDKK